VLRDVPGQQFVDAVGLVIGNVRKDVFQVGAWLMPFNLHEPIKLYIAAARSPPLSASEREIASIMLI